jgi:hypothetical protein
MSAVQEVIKEEIQKRIALSADYKSKLETATTSYKREYYSKKLHKNNQLIVSLLEGFERVTDKKENSDEAVSPTEQDQAAE